MTLISTPNTLTLPLQTALAVSASPLVSTLSQNVVITPPGSSSMTLTQHESLTEMAMEHVIGSTPNSPLKRPSKSSFLLECYQQASEDASRYACSASRGGGRRSDVSQLSILVHPEDPSFSCVQQDDVTPLIKRRAPRPLVGQKYTVTMQKIFLRVAADTKSVDNPVIDILTRGSTVRLLRYEVLVCGKLRAQVLTSDDRVGWCTMISACGRDMLELQLEEV